MNEGLGSDAGAIPDRLGDDDMEWEDRPSPWEQASAPSRWLFHWTRPLFTLSQRRVLCIGDLYRTPVSLEAQAAARQWGRMWVRKEAEGRSWLWLLLSFMPRALGLAWAYSLASDVFWYLTPRMSEMFLKAFQARNHALAYVIIGAFLAANTMRLLFEGYGNFSLCMVAARTRIAIMGTLYNKALRFSAHSRQRFTGGGLNIVSVNANYLYNLLAASQLFVVVPMRILVFGSIAFLYLGIAALPGLLFVALMVPFLFLMAHLLKTYRARLARITEHRMAMTQEALEGIKVLKFLTWEGHAAAKIDAPRAEEVKYLRKAHTLHSFALALNFWAPMFAATLSIGALAVVNSGRTDGGPLLRLDDVSAAVMAFQALINPLRVLPIVVNIYILGRTSLERFTSFLRAPEHRSPVEPLIDSSGDAQVVFDHACLVWETDREALAAELTSRKLTRKERREMQRRASRQSLALRPDATPAALAAATSGLSMSHARPLTEPFRLVDITLSIPRNALVAIIGPIGAGKTSLLEAMMGEMRLESGRVLVAPASDTLNGEPAPDIAYCAQHAWIKNATVRENIVFGLPYAEDRYRAAVDHACLAEDINGLRWGDETVVGERGATLSGGQRQRIGLARAYYAGAPTMLLDDPLSAVDASVAAHLFRSIRGMNDRTRILATHTLAVLPEVDLIVVLEECVEGATSASGRVRAVGTYAELVSGDDASLGLLREALLCSPHLRMDTIDSESYIAQQSPMLSAASDAMTPADGMHSEPRSIVPSSPSLNGTPRFAGLESPLGDIGGMDGARSPLLALGLENEVIAHSDDDNNVEDQSEAASEAEHPVFYEDVASYMKRSHRRRRRMEEKIAKRASRPAILAWLGAAGGVPAVSLLAALVISAQVARVASDYYMKARMDGLNKGESAYGFLFFYTAYGLLQGVLGCAGNILAVFLCIRASRTLHAACISRLLRARLSVFDSTPVGRIVNRFGRDLEAIDNNFPDKLAFLLSSLSVILSAIILIVVSTKWYLAVTVVLPLIGAYLVHRRFAPIWRQVHQLQGQSLGPILSHTSETLAGLVTVRAHAANSYFTMLMWTLLNDYVRTTHWLVGVRRWLGLASESVANAYVALLMTLCVTADVDPKITGLLLVYASRATDSIDWTMKMLAEVESCFVSVERLYKYVMDLEVEDAFDPGCQPAAAVILQDSKGGASPFAKGDTAATHVPNGAGITSPVGSLKDRSAVYSKAVSPSSTISSAKTAGMPWPAAGDIRFEHVQVRYGKNVDGPLAIKDFTLSIAAGERVGVVGRTGAGKSSVISCLFRFAPLAGGRVVIDGVDIATVPLRTLRGGLAMVPQEPTLFSGTLRHNMDPDGVISDERIWAALQSVNLREMVAAHPRRLDMEAGVMSSFSIGQRQLLCLARALLREARVIVMDEATSSIDAETETLIQRTLLSPALATGQTHGPTVITIAHRLETIMGYDRVVVMAAGEIAEVGRPRELAAAGSASLFGRMVIDAGLSL